MKYLFSALVILSLTVSFNGCSEDDIPVVPQKYILTVNSTGNGSFQVIPNKTEYDPGETVTLTASADTGWKFINWIGSILETDNPILIEVNNNMTITAVFERSYEPDITGIWGGIEYIITLILQQPSLTSSSFTGQAIAPLTTGDTLIYSVNGSNTPPTVQMTWNKTGYYQVTYNGVYVNETTLDGSMTEDGITYDLDFVKVSGKYVASDKPRLNIGKRLPEY